MSLKQGNLCSLLILEHFGETAQKVYDELQWGPRSMKLIISNTGLPIAVIRRVLCIFIQYGFVLFEPNKTGIAEYNLQPQRILLLLRYPKYLSLINNKYGETAKLVVEEILKNGRISMTKVILQVWAKLKPDTNAKFNNKVAGLQDVFKDLVLKQYLIKCPAPDNDIERVPHFTINEDSLFRPIELNLQKVIKLENGDKTVEDDDKIFWRCNYDRFHQDMRDELMVNAIRRRFDKHAAKLVEVILRLIYIRTDAWATQSNPVPVAEIREALDKEKADPYLIQFLEQYLKIVEEDSCQFIKRTSETLSASVYVNFVSAFSSLAYSTIENIVEHKFGHKASRIFRLVRNKVYIDQEQLQKMAMIPDKEAKQITYKLLQESFLYLHELKKSVSTGPVKNFYLFHVNINQVNQVVLDICFKTITNTISRATHDKSENIRLIEKVEKLNLLSKTLREQGNDEEYIKQVMDEFLSPPEKTLLESVENMIKKLRLVQLNVDDTIFIIQLFSYYESCKLLEKRHEKERK